ncbi:extracellular solute-binding protein [Enterococcus montenegrensis]|uniref:ABC transporter substrate-binding protein n=1 Tax=Enterococcus montenegrensis TaxID=3031993 RepID=UPI00249DD099|nr:extracellular solute-binding protein [Enterococcus montenegrensis]WHA09450.1 extracellular solute-binding protein [Enterococcus montenegrensis]
MKKMFLSLIAGIALFSMAGCSSANAKAQNEIDVWLTPQWKGTYSADEKNADYDSFLKTAAKMYEKSHPNVKINVQVVPGDDRDSKMSVATQTNTLPDVFFDSTFVLSTFAHQGLLEPFNAVIDKNNEADISDAIWNNVQIDGKTYFYPFAQNPGTLAYNADMFKAAGLEKYIGGEHEIATWTTDEFYQILTKLKEINSKVAPLGFFCKNNQGDTWNMMYLRMFGNQFFDEKGELVVNEESGVKALSFLEKLKEEKLIAAGPESLVSNDVNAMFQNQQVAVSFTNAMLFNGMLGAMKDSTVERFDTRLANVPGKSTPVSFTYVLGSGVFNTNGEKRKELAQDFVKFYSENKELVEASTNFLPVRNSVADEHKKDLPYLDAYLANDKYVVNFSNNSPGYAEIRNALYPELQAVMTGDKTPQVALDNFVKTGNKVIDRGLRRSKALENK